ncbi:uncharacterized protein N7511_003731 [Penicillium nucicola]|uniref:uncharacterized protein n=1 Tax=Penicillium nucicola TaxID=1850975 RepID=UPI002544F68D|nr:uncharacterized protein N7511_003731 [Penicillium nucicola]KAJ5766115.1 hypothetical protein N7511_003731 [Penicillium nucicola]
MVSFKSLLGAVAIAASIQSGSAILVEISLDVALGTIGGIVGAAGGVTGGVSAAVANSKREVDHIEAGPISRVKRQSYGTKYDWEQCHKELTTSHVDFNGESAGTVVVSGVPPTCMNLATVITGKFDEGNPVPLSNNAIRFTGLTNDDVNKIQDALNTHS